MSMPGKRLPKLEPKTLKQITNLKNPWSLFMFNAQQKTLSPGKFFGETTDLMGERALLAEIKVPKKDRGKIEYLVLNLEDEAFKSYQGRFLVIDFKTSERKK